MSNSTVGVSQVLVEKRRSSRRHKQTKFYIATQDPQPDLYLRAAIKRSKLERVHKKVDLESLPTVPIIRATEEEFKNPVLFWNKYTHLGQHYGAIKVIPPTSFKSEIPIDFSTYKFKIRQQNIKLLSSGKGYNHPPDLYTCSDLKNANEKLKNDLANAGIKFDTIRDAENVFWGLVESGNKDVLVSYGADLPSALPKSEEYAKHPWNLNNLSVVQGSLLRYMKHNVPGVNSPWLYLGMALTSFSWHTEDNYFGAINYHHTGGAKIWYIVPPSRANSLEKLLVDYISTEDREFALYSLRVQLSPNLLLLNNIPVYRIVQESNEFILLWPRTYHAGFNVDFNCNEACNIAPVNWIPMGYKSLIKYRYSRRSCIPFFGIIFLAATSFHDFSCKDLQEIGNMFKVLLIQEFQTRDNFKMARIMMDLDYKFLESCNEIKKLLDCSSCVHDNTSFSEMMKRLKKFDDINVLLDACKFASQICTKDCSICDSPLFVSSVTCPHDDMIFCGSCSKFSNCKCSEKIMLCRFPLMTLYTLLKLIDDFTGGQFAMLKSLPPVTRMNTLDKFLKCDQNDHNNIYLLKLEKALKNGINKRACNFLSVGPYMIREKHLATLLTCKYLIAAVHEEREEYSVAMA